MNNSVSVIITCYNLENYIGSAIDSVLKQEYDGPVELVAVDDCSTDRSAEIIKSYAQVRYLRPEKNLGVLMATVLGLENATGELVFFLDGDDIWERAKLSMVVERFKADPQLALVTHDLKYIDCAGHVIDRKSRPEVIMPFTALSDESSVIRDGILLHSDYVWLGSAYAVHRTLGNLEAFCVFARTLPDQFNTYQDWPLAFWVACQPVVRLGYVNCKLFRYRLHGANHSGDATTCAKAIRNVRRARNTTLTTRMITERFAADVYVQKATDRKLVFYAYLEDLYIGHRWRAVRGFLVSIPYLLTSSSSFWKEVLRFAGVQLLGLERFVRLSSARRCAPRKGDEVVKSGQSLQVNGDGLEEL